MAIKEATHNTLCQVKDLNLIDYSSAYQIQQETVRDVIAGGIPTLILCEHPPILTLGRLATEDNILLASHRITQKGVKILRINRGGEVTFHGPGQLVIYPIFPLAHFGKDLKRYMNTLEQVAIDLLGHFGIVANSIPGERGVWVNDKKIASIGIGVRKWVSFHGMAINVNTDLNYFSLIKPCGLNVQMTSISAVRGKEIDMKRIKEKAIDCFCERFHLRLV